MQPVVALEDCTFSIEKGSFSVIMEKPGSGKPTLLNIIALHEDEISGTHPIEGQEVMEKTL